jgi:hypothetical protein
MASNPEQIVIVGGRRVAPSGAFARRRLAIGGHALTPRALDRRDVRSPGQAAELARLIGGIGR